MLTTDLISGHSTKKTHWKKKTLIDEDEGIKKKKKVTYVQVVGLVPAALYNSLMT